MGIFNSREAVSSFLSRTSNTMSAFWRVAGLSYVQYSTIAARAVRQVLKGEAKDLGAKRDIVSIKFQKWEGGKPQGKKE